MYGDFVGDDIELGPHALANAKVGTLDHKASAQLTLGREPDWRDEFTSLILDGQLACRDVMGDTVGLELFEYEIGFGMCGNMKPGLADGLLVGFFRAGVDAGQIDLDTTHRLVDLCCVKTELSAEFFELAVHGHTHLLEAEKDGAFLGHDGLIGGGMSIAKEGGRQGECDSVFHGLVKVGGGLNGFISRIYFQGGDSLPREKDLKACALGCRL